MWNFQNNKTYGYKWKSCLGYKYMVFMSVVKATMVPVFNLYWHKDMA